MVRPPTGGHLTMGETWDGEFMKAKFRQVFFELLAFLCLFLAIGADWSTWERYQMSTYQTVHKHFSVSGNQYVTPQVAEMAVNQAIEAAKRREDRNQTPRAKVTVSVMGEKYTVENLRFDGFVSWIQGDKKSQFKETKKAQQVQDIIAAYCDYYRMCKGATPESVHLTESQFLALGANPGDTLYIGASGERATRVVLLDAGSRA